MGRTVSELMSASISNAITNMKTWSGIIVNVKEYGAKGDGKNDDTSPLQKAINAAIQVRGTLWFSPGTYLFTSLTINGPIIIQGNGSLLQMSPTLNRKGITVSADNVEIHSLQLHSIGNENDGLNTTGMYFDDGNGSIGYNVIRDVDIRNFSGAGIQYVNCIFAKIQHARIVSCNRGISCVSARGSNGTTMFIEQPYVQSCATGIYMERSSQSVIFMPIIEDCGVGIDLVANQTKIIGDYYENNTTFDLRAVDSRVARVGRLRGSSGITDSITWSFQSNDTRLYGFYDDSEMISRNWTHYYSYGTDQKTIKPYRYVSGENGNNRFVDGLVYGDNRIIPLIYGDNLLKPDGWDYPYDPNIQGVVFQSSGGGTIERRCSQTVTLSAGNYLYAAYHQNVVDSIHAVVVMNSGGTVIARFDTAGVSNAARRLAYLPFTIPTSGDYTIRVIAFASSIQANIFAVLVPADGDINNDDTWGMSSFDIAMRNSYKLSSYLSSLSGGYNLAGYKEMYGTAAPTTGTYKVGDKVINTAPSAGGYMGWVCVTAGTPGTWKGFGMIQA